MKTLLASCLCAFALFGCRSADPRDDVASRVVRVSDRVTVVWEQPPPEGTIALENAGPGSVWVSFVVDGTESERFEILQGQREYVNPRAASAFTLHREGEGTAAVTLSAAPAALARIRVTAD
jgi:hypothetical protein